MFRFGYILYKNRKECGIALLKGSSYHSISITLCQQFAFLSSDSFTCLITIFKRIRQAGIFFSINHMQYPVHVNETAALNTEYED